MKYPMHHEKIILWGIKASPYVQKVMVALSEKGVAYEQREILPKSISEFKGFPMPDDFIRASPLGKIPALQVDDFCIADSAVIMAYLDRKFKTGMPLYPNSPEEYAKALWFEHYADTTFSDVAYHKIFKECIIKPALLAQETNRKIVEQAIKTELPPMLDYLSQSVLLGPWIAGEHFSMADVAIVMQLLALRKAGVEISESKWSDINNYVIRVIKRPSFNAIANSV
jgi:glutathione S-transferase